MEWEVVIGIETHAQLSSVSKMFSGAATRFGAEPNAQACAVDIALPGVLPVANQGAVERAIRFGLAVGATINRQSVFARKNYFYPDLPKGYQISQYELPVVRGGTIPILTKDGPRAIRLTRAHLEEDAGKSLHEDFHGMSGIDLNRAGTPLLEIVSEPDLRSAAEAVTYAKALHALVRWIDICDGNMQEGSFRCDANVSVRKAGATRYGTRAEIKNLNSFRFVERAINYEVARQIEVLEGGGQVVQETRLYDADKGETRSMRSKEEANDYRYFPDPDLLPVSLDAAFIESVRATLPELPDQKAARFTSQYGLPAYDAGVLTASRELADYYESVVRAASADAKLAANWVMGELAAALNKENLEVSSTRMSPERLAGLLVRICDATISGKLAKEVFEAMWSGGADADSVIAERGLRQITDSAAIERVIDEVMQKNPGQLADYRAGKDKLFGFFVGQVMKASKGQASPQIVNELLTKKLG